MPFGFLLLFLLSFFYSLDGDTWRTRAALILGLVFFLWEGRVPRRGGSFWSFQEGI